MRGPGVSLVLWVYFLCFPWISLQASTLGRRDLTKLSSGAIASLIAHPDPIRNVDPKNPNSHLSKILIPRPPDTANNTLVKDYLVSTMKKLDWHVEEDTFTDQTPYGVKRFTNVIATKDPSASRRVVLAAHFDSKFFSTYPESQVRFHHHHAKLLLTIRLVVRRRNRLCCSLCIYARSCGGT